MCKCHCNNQLGNRPGQVGGVTEAKAKESQKKLLDYLKLRKYSEIEDDSLVSVGGLVTEIETTKKN